MLKEQEAGRGAATSEENFTYSFKDELFVQHFGLNEQNVLDYFARSDFYDKSCNNEQLKMQNQSIDSLRSMVGLEYSTIRTGHEPRLFVLVKQRRASPAAAEKLAIYVRFPARRR